MMRVRSLATRKNSRPGTRGQGAPKMAALSRFDGHAAGIGVYLNLRHSLAPLQGAIAILDPRTGGIASLNRRLMAGNPPGCRVVSPYLAARRSPGVRPGWQPSGLQNRTRREHMATAGLPLERRNLACIRHEGDKPLRSLTRMARNFRAARANGACESQTDTR